MDEQQTRVTEAVKAASRAVSQAGSRASEPVGYTVGKWKEKYDNYECGSCQYSTLDKAMMEKHIQIGDHHWPFQEGINHSNMHEEKPFEV